MKTKSRTILRLLWILFGIFALIGGIMNTISGFHGTLSPEAAGIGWLIISVSISFFTFGDIIKLLDSLLDKTNVK